MKRCTDCGRVARAFILLGVVGLVAACTGSSHRSAQIYDLVIANGRVMDPSSGLDAPRNVGTTGGIIRVVTSQPLRGRDTIDARGMVVAPGFIDLHQHAQDTAGYRVEVLDGTTTALELEGGTYDVDAWYDARAGKSLINHGVSIGHEDVRMRVMHDPGTDTPTGAARTRAMTAAELREMVSIIDQAFRRGAVAAGMILELTPAATPWEILEVYRAAAKAGASVHVHLRALPEAQYFLETEEVIAATAATGAATHIVHIQSSLGEDTPRGLELVRGARARGLDITTEVYPYSASMSRIEGADTDDWKTWSDKKFQRFEWALTGERLTRESFARYRAIGGYVVEYNNPESVVTDAVADSLTMIASDGILHGAMGHPRVAGTFARVLGRYSRDLKTLTLMDALRKMTIEPARRLEHRVPGMAQRGRLRPGASADVVVFNAATVIDGATYRQPTLPPTGIRDVLVNGVPVVRAGVLLTVVFPGQAIRGPIQ